MEGTSLLSLPEGMLVEQIQITENGIIIEVVATTPTLCCPLCSEPSSSIHCHYRRVLRDAPCAGRRVVLYLTVRKFSCCNPYCSRKVFAERFPDFVEPWARMTIRHCQQITSIGPVSSFLSIGYNKCSGCALQAVCASERKRRSPSPCCSSSSLSTSHVRRVCYILSSKNY
jgi:hypothetical protein